MLSPIEESELSLHSSVSGKSLSLPEPNEGITEWARYQWDQLGSDYGRFYSAANLANLAVGFAGGALVANSNLDESISQDFFRENFVDIANEDITQKLHSPKPLGDGYLILPAIGIAALTEPWLDRSPLLQPVGEWGNRSARAILVGGPFVLAMQRITGASRPNESHSQSHWEPFQDNNGVSGHAFVGAIPFLTAAGMTDSRILQALCYAASTLPAISRINDQRHYFSQVFLGWYVAFLASGVVEQTANGSKGLRLFPVMGDGDFGFLLEGRF